MTNPLAKFRKTKNLTLAEAAAQCGVNKTTFMRWEKGETNVTVLNVDRVAKVTGVPRNKLRCLTLDGATA